MFLQGGLTAAAVSQLHAAWRSGKLDEAADVLTRSVADGQLHAGSLYVKQGDSVFEKAVGAATSIDAIFLLASISKPMTAAALMTLYDQGKLGLEDPVKKFIPEFSGDGRENATIRNLLTHTSGLPDQLPDNTDLRKRNAPFEDFVAGAIRTPLRFQPGERFGYSSMGILLASEVAHRISGTVFLDFIDEVVYQPLGMKHSALGLGKLKLEDTMRCQVESAAPESGAGDPTAKSWDWNSPYWRALGSPWGGAHASAPDVARFFAEFLHPTGKVIKVETARLMLENHSPEGVAPRALGFGLGPRSGGAGCSERTFGHGGSTGTLAWADPASDTICVVLTTLPGRAAKPHPRTLASDLVAGAVV